MRNEDLRYVLHEDVEEHKKQGWALSDKGFLPTDRHAEYAVIMSKEAPLIQPMTITLRQPNVDKAELVITVPGEPSMVRVLSFAQVRLLNRQTAEALESWPVIPA